MNQSPEDAARSMFPLMPDEVFDGWLAPLIAKRDWPYLTGRETDQVGKWPGMLLDRTPAEWARLVWNLEHVQEVDELLAKPSRHLVGHLLQHFTSEGDAASRAIRDSENRFWQARQALIDLGGFPGFVVALREDGGKIVVVDGHHRLAALLTFPGFNLVPVPVWIASPSV